MAIARAILLSFADHAAGCPECTHWVDGAHPFGCLHGQQLRAELARLGLDPDETLGRVQTEDTLGSLFGTLSPDPEA